MDPVITTVGAYAIFCLVGGVIGYFKAGSRASLIAGIVSMTLLSVGAYGIDQGSRNAVILCFAVAFLLGARFLGTWFKKRKLMPDLVMVLFSAAAMTMTGLRLLGKI